MSPIPDLAQDFALIIIPQLYLAVNYDLQQFMLAPVDTETVGVLDIVSFNSTSSFDCPSNSNKWSIGVIVLAVILALLVIIICIYVYKKRGEGSRPEPIINNSPPSQPVELGAS